MVSPTATAAPAFPSPQVVPMRADWTVDANSRSATDESTVPLQPSSAGEPTVVLIDGNRVCLADYDDRQLGQLQYDQERAFAIAIAAAPKDSLQRLQVTRHAYQSVCEILDEIAKRGGDSGMLSMGMDARYIRLVKEILAAHRSLGLGDGLFEVGFGSGLLLQAASAAGYRVAGLEVAPQLLESAKQLLPDSQHDGLLLGDFRSVDLAAHQGRYGLVYWNDVFEHIPVDEISDYLVRIRSLLVPGGQLLTITPNWHMRPSDVTSSFMGPRNEAVGFHLKEYKLGEVSDLLLKAGFSRVQTPTFIGRNRMWMSPLADFTSIKIAMEPLLEWLPYRVAVQCCRRFGFNCTLATST